MVWEELDLAWETRRFLGGLVSTSLDLPWGFLPVCESGRARVGLDLVRSCGFSIVIALYLAVTRKALQPGMLDEYMMILL